MEIPQEPMEGQTSAQDSPGPSPTPPHHSISDDILATEEKRKPSKDAEFAHMRLITNSNPSD